MPPTPDQTPTPPSARFPSEAEVFRDSLAALCGNQAKVLTDLWGAEDNTRQVYSERFVFELMQNARDAAARGDQERPRVLFQLTDDALIVANDGAPFDRGGYEAVTGIGKSSKPDEGLAAGARLIGRKGIGFKSVLRVSRRPQIFGNTSEGGRLSLEFGSERIQAMCRAIADGDVHRMGDLLEPREHDWFHAVLGDTPLARTSLAQSVGDRDVSREMLLDRLPVMLFPLWVAEPPDHVTGLLDADGYDTVVRLPLQPDRVQEVRRRLVDDVVPEKLLFLGHLSVVRVIDETVAGRRREWQIDARWNPEEPIVTLKTTGLPGEDGEGLPGSVAVQTYRFFDHQAKVPVADGVFEQREVRVAVPIDGARVHVEKHHPMFNYYPISDEGRLLPLLLHAEFEVDPGRTKFSPEHGEINRTLLSALAEVLTGSGQSGDGSVLGACLGGTIDGRGALPGLLLPRQSERQLPTLLRETIVSRLRERPCVPCKDGRWRIPSETLRGPLLDAVDDVFDRVLERVDFGLPHSAARHARDFDDAMAALGGVPFDAEHLHHLLDHDASGQWRDVSRFRQLFALIMDTAHQSEMLDEDVIERYRPSGDGPRIGLLPCTAPDGAIVAQALPATRVAGGQTAEERARFLADVQVVHRASDDALDRPPPDAMRLRFLHPDLLEQEDDLRLRTFIEEVLEVRPYSTREVLQRIEGIDFAGIPDADVREVARFIVTVVGRGRTQRWALFNHLETEASIHPEQFFAGFPREEEEPADASAREALARLRLPAGDGRLVAAEELRFTGRWGPQYESLHTLDPPSVTPLADPEDVAAYLAAERIADELDGTRKDRLDDALEGVEHRAAGELIAHAFCRLVGVWETIPLGYVPSSSKTTAEWPLERLEEVASKGGELAEFIESSSYNAFHKDKTYRHQRTRLARGWWLRDEDLVGGSPEHCRTLLDVLAEGWRRFFGWLGHTELYCPRCYDGNRYHRSRLTNASLEDRPPSPLYWTLRHRRWYVPIDGSERRAAPDSLWIVPDPPSADGLDNSPFRFVPHVRETDPTYRRVLEDLGVVHWGDAPAARCLDLLDDLRDRFEGPDGQSEQFRDGPAKVAFRAVHEALYEQLRDILRLAAEARTGDEMIERWHDDPPFDDRVGKLEWARIQELPLLVEVDGRLAYRPGPQVLIDDGRDTYARNLFQDQAPFAVVGEAGSAFARIVGAQRFDVIATPELDGPTDVTDTCHELLSAFLPALVAVTTRIVPGGGRPVEPGGKTFQRRLARFRQLRFVQCDDLAIHYQVRGHPELETRHVGKGRRGEAFLESQGERRPTIYFDHHEDDLAAVLPRLAPELARVLATPEYQFIFEILLEKHDRSDRIDYLERRGVRDADIKEVARQLGHEREHEWHALRAVWAALEAIAPPGAVSLSPNLPEELSEGASAVSMWRKATADVLASDALTETGRIALEAAPRLLSEPALRTGHVGSALHALEEAGFSLASLSEELARRDRPRIRIDDHRDTLADMRAYHSATLRAALIHEGADPRVAGAALDDAFQVRRDWLVRATVPHTALTDGIRTMLESHGLRIQPPTPGERTAAFRTRVAEALGVAPAELMQVARDRETPEQRRAERSGRFARRLAATRPLLIALALGDGDHRVARVRDVAELLSKRVTLPDQDPIDEPLSDWLIDEVGLSEDHAQAILDEPDPLDASTLERIGAQIARRGLSDTVARVRRVLDEGRRRRARKAHEAYERHSGVQNPEVIAPENRRDHQLGTDAGATVRAADEASVDSAGADPDSSADPGRELPQIRRGAYAQDESERRRAGDLGEQGEMVAFAWAVAPLVELHAADHARFLEVVGQLRDWLNRWRMTDDLRDYFDAAVAELKEPHLHHDEIVANLADLIHLSGDRASDGFGFDLVAYLPERARASAGGSPIFAVEVKTSRRFDDAFHFSEHQYNVAARLRRSYGVLRVAHPSGDRPPQLRLYLDPVGLAEQVDGLVLEPEAFRGRTIDPE